MYSVTKRIDFCYGHRLLDYDGVCKHPHGHNAVAEIEVRTDALDNRNMVVDFSDIKRVVKGWIDRELDHKMILRHDDPLVAPLTSLGEPMYLLDSNLVDSRRDLTDSANQLIEELGGTRLREEDVGRMIGEGAAILVRRALEAAGLHDRPGALARFLDIYDP